MNQLPNNNPHSSNFYNDQTQAMPHNLHSPLPPSGTGFPPPPGQTSVPPVSPPLTKPYSQRILWLFVASYGLIWILFIMGNTTPITWMSTLGMYLCFGLLVAVLLLDAHGVAGLQGLVPWQRIRGTNTGIGLGSLAICLFPIWLGIYLACTHQAYRKPPLNTASLRRKPYLALLAASAVTLLFVGVASTSNTATTTQAVATPKALHQVVINTASATASSASSVTEVPTKVHSIPTPLPTQVPTPTPIPPTPTPVPPTAAPTQSPVPTPTPVTRTGLGGNPYGYDLDPTNGQVIASPPADICSYLACIPSFWKGKGYVEQCQDGMFSKSGGRAGSCSQHGGDKQPLYAHD